MTRISLQQPVKRLDRYLVREMIVPFLIGQGAVVLMLTGTVLYNNADTFLNNEIPALAIVKIAFYFLPYLVNLTMPVAMAIAASLTVSRLARDSEITVMRAAGISLKRVFLPLFAIGLVVSFADFYFGERVVPWANQQFEKTMTSLSFSKGFRPQPGQVIQSPDQKITASIGGMELRKDNSARMTNVMILQGGLYGKPATVTLAPSAEYRNGIWTLYNANIYTYSADGTHDRYGAAKTVTVDFKLAQKTFQTIYLQLPLYSNAATKTFRQLSEEVALQRRARYVDPRLLLEYHFKLSVPFSCLVFAIACPPLALKFARAGNFMGVLLSIVLVFVYWNTLLAAKILGSKYPNMLPPAVAGWGQNLVFSLIGLYFLWRGE